MPASQLESFPPREPRIGHLALGPLPLAQASREAVATLQHPWPEVVVGWMKEIADANVMKVP
jgi:hypothetical protein